MIVQEQRTWCFRLSLLGQINWLIRRQWLNELPQSMPEQSMPVGVQSMPEQACLKEMTAKLLETIWELVEDLLVADRAD